MMALQVCNRCRKRRIRCDLQLPTCKNCRLADVECLFWDDSLGQDIPCSYLYSLQQKVQGLKLQIQFATAKDRATLADPANDAGSAQLLEQEYNLGFLDHEDLPSPSRTAYLGSGNSARLLEHLLKSTVNWHLANNVQIPKRLLPDEPSHLIRSQDFKPLQSFPMTYDQRKLELYSLVPPSTQRAIIEHYLKIVSPAYTLLSTEEESSLLVYENPLKWSSSNKDDPGVFAIGIVFAISTAMVTRDLDSNLSSISMRCREEMYKVSQRVVSPEGPIETMRWTCTALCALALCELINPISGQLWDLLGRAVSTMEQLREGYQLRYPNQDEDFRRLERSLLKLESSAALHLRRPSQLCEIRLRSILEDSSMPGALSDELEILSHLHNIAYRFTTSPRSSEEFFQSLIPPSMQVDSANSDISLYSATLYTALHPLFTTSDVCSSSTVNDPSSRLFHVIASSASTIIDHFTRLNESNEIVSIWMAAERVIEGGAIWATYLMSQRRTTPIGQHGVSSLGTGIALNPILKVSTLLASFAARWKGGSAYVDVWEALVELLWNML